MSYSAQLTESQAKAISSDIYSNQANAMFGVGSKYSVTSTRITLEVDEDFNAIIYSNYTNDDVIDEIDEDYRDLFIKD